MSECCVHACTVACCCSNFGGASLSQFLDSILYLIMLHHVPSWSDSSGSLRTCLIPFATSSCPKFIYHVFKCLFRLLMDSSGVYNGSLFQILYACRWSIWFITRAVTLKLPFRNILFIKRGGVCQYYIIKVVTLKVVLGSDSHEPNLLDVKLINHEKIPWDTQREILWGNCQSK